MSGKINANICEIGGAYYQVRLEWVPRAGELIHLYSFADTATGHEATHLYEVVQIVHKVYDIVEGDELAQDGHHFVSIYVKPSHDKLFQS